MKFDTSAPPKPHPAGPAKLYLEKCELIEQPSFKDKNVMEVRCAWKFKSNIRDEETDARCTHVEWTGTRYGNPKAGLTIFANMLMPNLCNPAYLQSKGYAKPEDCFVAEFDSDNFVNKYFDAQFIAGVKDNGDFKTTLAFIAPQAVAQPAPVTAQVAAPALALAGVGAANQYSPVPAELDEHDPFADD